MKAKFKVKAIDKAVGELHLHSAANRELRPGRVQTLEREMDLDALGRFTVWRDGRNFYVIDGQHRKIALERLGLADWPVRCDLIEGATFMDACELFLKLNSSLTVRPFDKFDKGVKAGRRECVETDRIVRQHGLVVSPTAGDGKFPAVAAGLNAYKLDQGEALSISLQVSTGAWGHTAAAVEGHIITGLSLIAAKYNGDLDYDALIKKLSKYPGGPGRLQGAAKDQRDFKGGTIGRNIATIVVDLYNKGRRNKVAAF